MGSLEPDKKGLPFEDSLTPELCTSIFWQLWGFDDGGSVSQASMCVSGETPNCNDKVCEDKVVGVRMEEELGGMEEEKKIKAQDVPSLDCLPPPSTMKLLWSSCVMTANIGLDLQPTRELVAGRNIAAKPQKWNLDFGNMFGTTDEGLTDDNTVTSVASEDTIRMSGRCRASTLEEHKIGRVVHNPGPLFAVGDVINCDEGKHGRQWAFVCNADHPPYQLKLESGATVSTSMQETWLTPQFATGPGNPNNLAPPQDDPFPKLRRNFERGKAGTKQRIGSYGVHGNAQRKSLCLVEEAKVHAKAVKANNAEIPVHLWNNQIQAPGVLVAKKGLALEGFCKLGFRVFMRGLVRDCCVHMKQVHRKTWWKEPCKGKDRRLTEIGRDQEAIMSMLWHSTHTN